MVRRSVFFLAIIMRQLNVRRTRIGLYKDAPDPNCSEINPMNTNKFILLFLSLGYSIATPSLPLGANKLALKKNVASSHHERFVRRDGPYEPWIADAFLYYTTTVLIGSNEEEVHLTVDLGTSDLWVLDQTGLCDVYFEETYLKRSLDSSPGAPNLLRKRESNDSSSQPNYLADCKIEMTFDSRNSATFHSNGTTFDITYFDGTSASGIWGTDTIYLGDLEVSNQSFGLANLTTAYYGVLGLGPSNLQTTNTNSSGEKFVYSGILDSMRDQGLINSASYSIYLYSEDSDDLENYNDEGAILFGAIDQAKIDGSLKLLPYVISGGHSQIDANFTYVTLNNIAVNENDTALVVETNPQLAMLNPKFMYTYFPRDMLTRLVASISPYLEYDSDMGLYRADPEDLLEARDKVIEFRFGEDIVIRSPVSDYLYETWTSGQNYTYLEIGDSKEDFFILGNAFFQSTYLFFDNDNSEVGIGQVIRDTDEEDIVPVGEFTLEQDSGYSSTWSTFTHETGSLPLGTSTIGLSSESRTTSSNATSSGTASSVSSSSASETEPLTSTSSSETISGTGTETSSDGAAPPAFVGVSSCLFAFVLLLL